VTIKATDIQITGLSYDFSQALVDIDFSRADGDKSACTVFEGKIGGSYSPSATLSFKLSDWDALLFGLSPSRPKWGQPGRHRRRKARQAARRLNEDRQRARAMLERLEAAEPRRERAAMNLRRERAAVKATLRPAPEGPLFEAGTASDACQILPIVTHELDELD